MGAPKFEVAGPRRVGAVKNPPPSDPKVQWNPTTPGGASTGSGGSGECSG